MWKNQPKLARRSRALGEALRTAGPFLPLYYAIRALACFDLRKRCRQQRALVLTYDDGPGTTLTEHLLQTLADYDAQATFFLLGSRAEQHPGLVDTIRLAGHDIGVHTYSHLHPWKVSKREALADIDRGYSALNRWMSAEGLFRPPNGKLSWATWTALRRQNTPLCWWTLDSGDTWPALPPASLVVDAAARENGGVVLMHDVHSNHDRDAFVLDTTRGLLEMARSEGLKPMSLSALLSAPRR